MNDLKAEEKILENLEESETIVTMPSDVLKVGIVQRIAKREQEHFLVICLNPQKEVIKKKIVAIGSISTCNIHQRDVFREAVRSNAAAIIAVHNHPSGHTDPSEADVKTTETILKSAEILGIPLLDHIIVGKYGYFSFLEHDMCFG